VAVGATVRFRNLAPSEAHNMVFIGTRAGEKATAEDFAATHQQQTDLLPAFGPANQVMPDYVYGSEPSTGPGTWTYSDDEFGIGYLQTPLMDDAPGDPPAGLPGEETVVFTRAGTYHYYCGIHGKDMSGTVTVQ